MIKTVMLYITASNKKEAKKIGTILVKERLVACVNIIDKIQSVYWWKGKIEEGAEAALIAKTRLSIVKKTMARVRELHSYECPCIIALPIIDGNPAFLEWIAHETK
jgi:periplasmic divalent cation tolerance protein